MKIDDLAIQEGDLLHSIWYLGFTPTSSIIGSELRVVNELTADPCFFAFIGDHNNVGIGF